MNDFKEILNKYELILNRLTIKNGVRIINTNKGDYVLKKNKSDNLDDTYKYLKSRAFDYFPSLVYKDKDYYLYEYIEGTNEPIEQKALDLINLLSLLHNKTTFYKEVDIDDYKIIYEDIANKIENIYNYYIDIINLIDNSVYMSPIEYLIARNINKIYSSINYSKKYLDRWYELIKDKRKMRVVNIHNNLSIDHYIKDTKPYLISWDKSKIDIPIYDLYNLYMNHYLEIDFSELLYQYELKYPLLEEERILLFSIMMIPSKLELDDNEYNLVIKGRKLFDYLYKTENLVTNYQINQKPNIE